MQHPYYFPAPYDLNSLIGISASLLLPHSPLNSQGNGWKMESQEEGEYDVKKILLDKMMQDKLAFSILIWKEKRQNKSGAMRSDADRLILSFLGWNPGWYVYWGKGHS